MTSRLMPRPWFNAQSRAVTMAHIHRMGMTDFGRLAPLGKGERRLGWLVLPPFQRPAVWTPEQQARFIESAWMGLPLGSWAVNHPNDVRSPLDCWVLDGQQRITAILAYVGDAFPVFGHRWSALPRADQRHFDMGIVFPCLEVSLTTVEECREVYDRLAYGGTPHDPAERAG